MLKAFVFPFCLLAGAATSAAAASSFTVGFDRSTFIAAETGPYTVENFSFADHYPLPVFKLDSTTQLTFASGALLLAGDVKAGVNYAIKESGNSRLGFFGGSLGAVGRLDYAPLYTTFAKPTHSFGFDSVGMSQVDVTVSFVDRTTKNFHTTVIGDTFFGFTSTGGANILSATIGSTNIFPPLAQYIQSFDIDNFTYDGGAGNALPPAGVPLAVPEPGVAPLMACGLVALMWVNRRRAQRH